MFYVEIIFTSAIIASFVLLIFATRMSDHDLFGWDLLYKTVEKCVNKEADIVVALAHWYLIRNSNFRCVGIGDNKTLSPNDKGSELLPDGWNEGENYYALRYVFNEKLYILLGAETEGVLVLNLLDVEIINDSNLAVTPKEEVKCVRGSLEEMIPNVSNLISRIKLELVNPVFTRSKTKIAFQTHNANEENTLNSIISPHPSSSNIDEDPLSIDISNLTNIDDISLIKLLQDKKLVASNRKCPKCRIYFKLIKNKVSALKYCFNCPKCRKTRSILKGTFFENTHIGLRSYLNIIFLWSINTPLKIATKTLELTKSTVHQAYFYIQEICSWKIINMSKEFVLGGAGHIVQIDGTLVTKRKLKKGRRIREKWILGMYDTVTKKGIIVYIVKRNKNTLIPIIRQYVETGSEIWTNKLRAYQGLDKHGYLHRTINRSKNVRDPVNGVCINSVEEYLSKFKRYCRSKSILSSKLLPQHMDEFLYREHYKDRNIFAQILEDISTKYKV